MRHFIFIATLIVPILSGGQSVSKLKSAKSIGWCGIDYSLVKCIGSEGFNDPSSIVREYFTKWNDLVLVEPQKYKVNKCCAKIPVIYKTEISAERNKDINEEGLVITGNYNISEKEIIQTISSYPKLEGVDVGFVLIAEKLSKTDEAGVMYAVFFDAATNEVIWFKRYTGKTGGFGFRNHWATPIAEILEKIPKDFKRLVK